MKKSIRILALILAMAFVFSMLACAAKPNATAPADEAPAAEAPASESGEAAASADDTVYDLSFTIHQPATTAFCKAIDEWAANLKAKSNGRLNVVVYYGGTLASAMDALEFVQQGGADICWNTVSLNASKFAFCNIMSMYGADLTNAQLSTYVYSNLCKNCPAFAAEFENMGVKLLAAHGMTPSLLAGNDKKPEALADFSGMSIMSISKTCISVLDGFGAAVIGVTPADLYENFSKNVVQASLIDSSLYVANKLYEQFSWMNTYNYNSALAFVVMNQAKYDSLPADLQDILMSEFDTLSMACARYTDEDLTAFVNDIAPQYNIDIYDATPEVVAAAEEQLAKLVKEPWVEACGKAGYNAEEIQAMVEQYIAEGRAQFGAEYDWFN